MELSKTGKILVEDQEVARQVVEGRITQFNGDIAGEGSTGTYWCKLDIHKRVPNKIDLTVDITCSIETGGGRRQFLVIRPEHKVQPRSFLYQLVGEEEEDRSHPTNMGKD